MGKNICEKEKIFQQQGKKRVEILYINPFIRHKRQNTPQHTDSYELHLPTLKVHKRTYETSINANLAQPIYAESSSR